MLPQQHTKQRAEWLKINNRRRVTGIFNMYIRAKPKRQRRNIILFTDHDTNVILRNALAIPNFSI